MGRIEIYEGDRGMTSRKRMRVIYDIYLNDGAYTRLFRGEAVQINDDGGRIDLVAHHQQFDIHYHEDIIEIAIRVKKRTEHSIFEYGDDPVNHRIINLKKSPSPKGFIEREVDEIRPRTAEVNG